MDAYLRSYADFLIRWLHCPRWSTDYFCFLLSLTLLWLRGNASDMLSRSVVSTRLNSDFSSLSSDLNVRGPSYLPSYLPHSWWKRGKKKCHRNIRMGTQENSPEFEPGSPIPLSAPKAHSFCVTSSIIKSRSFHTLHPSIIQLIHIPLITIHLMLYSDNKSVSYCELGCVIDQQLLLMMVTSQRTNPVYDYISSVDVFITYLVGFWLSL